MTVLPQGIKLGENNVPHPNKKNRKLRDELVAWVAKTGQLLRICERAAALKKGEIKAIPVSWQKLGKRYSGTAFLKADCDLKNPPHYVAVECAEWAAGVVETVSLGERNEHLLAQLRFDASAPASSQRNYWITTHWPRWVDMPPDKPREGVFVEDGKESVIADMQKGDLVFIYEFKEGRTKAVLLSTGETRKIPCSQGKEGIVALVEVNDLPKEIQDSAAHDYTDGSKIWWRYKADTKSVNSAGFVPRSEFNRVLGYDENYVLRGFGDDRSGVKKITSDEFHQLLALYNASSTKNETDAIESSKQHAYGGGGEGPEHLALKIRIEQNPSGLLGEPGLQHYYTEFPFATNDRVDIVLKDMLGRFVAVEVEVDCSAKELAGPLQCMKYQAMLSYLFGIPVEEVRTVLVAHSIHQEVKARCAAHLIETVVIPRI